MTTLQRRAFVDEVTGHSLAGSGIVEDVGYCGILGGGRYGSSCNRMTLDPGGPGLAYLNFPSSRTDLASMSVGDSLSFTDCIISDIGEFLSPTINCDMPPEMGPLPAGRMRFPAIAHEFLELDEDQRAEFSERTRGAILSGWGKVREVVTECSGSELHGPQCTRVSIVDPGANPQTRVTLYFPRSARRPGAYVEFSDCTIIKLERTRYWSWVHCDMPLR